MKGNPIKYIELARLAEWVGEPTYASKYYEELKNQVNNQKVSIEFWKFIEPLIKFKESNLPKENKNLDYSQKRSISADEPKNLFYSIQIIDHVYPLYFIQIRGFHTELKPIIIKPLHTDLFNNLQLTSQFHNDILILTKQIDINNAFSISIDSQGIIIGEALFDEECIKENEGVRQIKSLLKTIEDIFFK